MSHPDRRTGERFRVVDLILLGLATWYIQHVTRWETGPFGLLDQVREDVFGVQIDETGSEAKQLPIRPGPLADLVMCIYCSSFWAALIVLVSWHIAPFFARLTGVAAFSALLGGLVQGDA